MEEVTSKAEQEQMKNALRKADETLHPKHESRSGAHRSRSLSWPDRQSHLRRTHRISHFLPGPLYFVHIWDHIFRRAIRDCSQRQEIFKKSVQTGSGLLF